LIAPLGTEVYAIDAGRGDLRLGSSDERDVGRSGGPRELSAFVKRLGERFGKPIWVGNEEPLFVVGWKIGDGAFEVSLLQRKTGTHKFSTEVTLAEPQGESEE
jgi:hypothetical protein